MRALYTNVLGAGSFLQRMGRMGPTEAGATEDIGDESPGLR